MHTQQKQAYLFVIAARDFASSFGMYMMMPTQLNRSAGFLPGRAAAGEWAADAPAQAAAAGLMGLLLPLVHLCSMGLGAGILFASISFSRSSMYARSAPFGSLQGQRPFLIQ